MEEKIFQSCLEQWRLSDGYSKFWPQLAEKWGYRDGELLRDHFKKERKRRGITKDEKKVLHSKCKILCFDIETSPICALVWGIWEQNVNLEAILNDWHIISWSAKYLFDDEIMSDVLTPEEAINHDDSRLVKTIWNLLNSVDVTVSHNGDRFDCKKLNTRFLFHGLPPVSHYLSIDTLVVAKSNFNFTSNKLDYINEYLGLPKKIETRFELWKKCWFGDSKALKEMELYNRGDVDILEDLYLKLRPYIRNHPNMNLWSEENISVCPNCGSEKLDWNQKEYFTYTGKYKAFRCNDCTAIGRSRQLETDKEKRKTIVR